MSRAVLKQLLRRNEGRVTRASFGANSPCRVCLFDHFIGAGEQRSAASARGVLLGRQVGQRPSDKKTKKVLAQHREGLSYRLIGRNLGLSKNTAMEIIKREAG